MPHITFKGISVEDVRELSTKLIDDMSYFLETPRDYFTLEVIENTFIYDGKIGLNKYPIIYVEWFDRGQDAKDNCARIITTLVKRQIEKSTIHHQTNISDENCISVIFKSLQKDSYYDNGEHY
ncbi:MAG: DUF1904 family protein [Candidatus Delongbacteria bacterium]|nr:DUF1904 family protein [Candidatus Delongbacteria bacterium]MBN2834356.1 DUF1904 family protein [Candidatus Delongbacteria bacterium]